MPHGGHRLVMTATANRSALTGHPEAGRRLADEADNKQPGNRKAYDGIWLQLRSLIGMILIG